MLKALSIWSMQCLTILRTIKRTLVGKQVSKTNLWFDNSFQMQINERSLWERTQNKRWSRVIDHQKLAISELQFKAIIVNFSDDVIA